MLGEILRGILRGVIGGGADISPANPVPVDVSPGAKTATTILTVANLPAGATTLIGACASIDLSGGPPTLALTIEATYNAAAALGIRIHVRTSYDDVNWDSEDWDAWNPTFTAGAAIRQTRHYDTSPMYVRVLVENLDAGQAVTNIAVIATVGA